MACAALAASVTLAALPARAATWVEQQVTICLACHAGAGLEADAGIPVIDGQPRQFIATELFQYREGHRKDERMSPLAAGLSNAQLNELAAWFAARPAPPPARVSEPATAAAGEALAGRLHCVSCHGPRLIGQQHIPRIAGQRIDYLRTQLRGFRAGTRADIDGLMTSAAQALQDADIDVLADYLSALDPR